MAPYSDELKRLLLRHGIKLKGIFFGFPFAPGVAPRLLPDRYTELKSLFTAGRERVLAESWEKLLLDHEKQAAVMKKFGSNLIPQVRFQDLASISKEEIEDTRERGVVVIKNVLPEKERLAVKESLKEHIKRNSWTKDFPSLRLRPLLKAKKQPSLPTDSPAVYELYYTGLGAVYRESYLSLVISQCFLNSL
ncbi:hypothetical protein B9Z19DRAFT_1131043 [Tuber borchii]|uniref:Uncharacterized protein n=1 Tax=Tuber borchii TaxID=42251 RepID=A0A2T6ZJC2_TUBBO|nr:hypothetical protein B9Z19DRAFT_1131043 [Tuber borchii]